MEAVLKVGKPTVVLNMTGSAMDLRIAQEQADAVMQLWYPGARGGRVVAQMLFGEISPSGKLPVTFYRDTAELPDFEDYSMKGRTYRYIESEPLYPFGYGLTYGDVKVSAVSCSGSPAVTGSEIALEDQDAFKLHVKLTNSGEVATDQTAARFICLFIYYVCRPMQV